MTSIKRRDFLRGALALGAGAATVGAFDPLARLALANGAHPDAPDRYYVFCYFSGGWDVLLSLDPRDPAAFPNSRTDETLIQPGYGILQGTAGREITDVGGGTLLGPYMGRLASHFDKMAIIRGMSMETLSHDTGRRRFITGKAPSGNQARGSSAATWLAAHLGEGQPIPNVAVRVESYNVDQPVYATGMVANSVSDLIQALGPGDPALEAFEQRQLDELLTGVTACEDARQSLFLQQSEMARQQAAAMVSQRLDQEFDFFGRSEEMQRLRDHYGIGNLADVEANMAMASQALKRGVSRVVSVSAANGLDTHGDDWARNQGPRQERGFDAISLLVEDLAATEYGESGSSWLDHTVIIGFSEFSRTPMLNDNGGRDHHLTNSAFLLGGAVDGGQIIGRSSDTGMAPVPIDLDTGRENFEEGEVVLPEHIMHTLFDEVGIDPGGPDLRVRSLGSLLKG